MDLRPLGPIVGNANLGGRYDYSRQSIVGGDALGGVGPSRIEQICAGSPVNETQSD